MVTKVLEKIEQVYVKINSLFTEHGKILMFHHVSDEFVDTIDCCKCKVNRFKEIVEQVGKSYEFISIDNIYNRTGNKKYAVITFDDGCMDTYQNAFPYLLEHNIPFTVYVVSDFVDKDGYLGVDELKHLAKNPLVTIGYHTKSHPQLIRVRYLREEMYSHKHELEEIIGKKIDHFAFPYGKLYAVGIKSVFLGKQLGYKTVVSTFDTYLSRFSLLFKFFLPRTVIM